LASVDSCGVTFCFTVALSSFGFKIRNKCQHDHQKLPFKINIDTVRIITIEEVAKKPKTNICRLYNMVFNLIIVGEIFPHITFHVIFYKFFFGLKFLNKIL
jgi:hypothetical protein